MKKGILISVIVSLILLGGCSSGKTVKEKPATPIKQEKEAEKTEKVDSSQLAKRAIRQVKRENFEKAKSYIEKGADVNIESRGTTILAEAIRSENIDFIKYLLNTDVNLDFEDEDGNTYLMMAKQGKVAEMLLKAGLDPNKANSKGRKIIFEVAASPEKVDVLKALVNNGADLNVQNVRGNTPLMMAIMEKNTVGAKLLIKSGVNVDVQNENGNPALMKATNPEIIMDLIEVGADLSMDNKKGQNVGKETFMLAIYKGYEEVVEKLIEKEIGVNFVDSYGDTPLGLAKSQGDEKIIEILEMAGAKE